MAASIFGGGGAAVVLLPLWQPNVSNAPLNRIFMARIVVSPGLRALPLQRLRRAGTVREASRRPLPLHARHTCGDREAL
jgi:hypothetical protein